MTFDEYQRQSRYTAIYPGHGSTLGLFYASGALASEAGEVAGHVSKAIRDDHFGSVTDRLMHERRELIINEMGDTLWHLAALCDELHITLEEVAHLNLDKVYGRAERGKVSGSGDKR